MADGRGRSGVGSRDQTQPPGQEQPFLSQLCPEGHVPWDPPAGPTPALTPPHRRADQDPGSGGKPHRRLWPHSPHASFPGLPSACCRPGTWQGLAETRDSPALLGVCHGGDMAIETKKCGVCSPGVDERRKLFIHSTNTHILSTCLVPAESRQPESECHVSEEVRL